MNLHFVTFSAALVCLLAAASCAPAALHDACADVRSSSLELNRQARMASLEARKGDRSESNFTTSLAWMEAKDMCDPVTLRQTPSTCVGKILHVLRSYNSYVEMISGYQRCSQFADRVKPALRSLLGEMSRCVNSKAGIIQHQESHPTVEDPHSLPEALKAVALCRYTLDRLYSFSILTARVFAVGDPSHHSDGSVQMCM